MVIRAIQAIERETAFTRGKGQKTHSILQIVEDVPAGEMETHLKTDRSQAPQLVLFMSEGKLDVSTVIVDGTPIETRASDILQSVFILLGCYYVFDLTYPRVYSQVLAFLQQFVLKQMYTGKKSAKYLQFIHELKLV